MTSRRDQSRRRRRSPVPTIMEGGALPAASMRSKVRVLMLSSFATCALFSSSSPASFCIGLPSRRGRPATEDSGTQPQTTADEPVDVLDDPL